MNVDCSCTLAEKIFSPFIFLTTGSDWGWCLETKGVKILFFFNALMEQAWTGAVLGLNLCALVDL